MSKPLAIRDLDHLFELLKAAAATDDSLDCFISLNGGANSSKTLKLVEPASARYKVPQIEVLNEIDDSFQLLWPAQLWTRSNIGQALDVGAFYARV